jgi:hypothetical protein
LNYREHYIAAHKVWFSKEYPTAWKDGFWSAPKFPKVATANGLTQFIINFLNWNGHRATRISSSGRQVAGKWIYGTTRKGSADISATIKGRSVMIEVKVGKDRPSPDQLKEQAKERAAGGLYEFCRTPEEFLELYRLIVG